MAVWVLRNIFAIRMSNLDFYYFSGTGNTFLVVRRMAEVFRQAGWTVRLLPIEQAEPATINRENVIGLAFPVAGQSTYPFVWDFIQALPEAPGTKVFMVDTLAGFSGGIVGPLKKVLNAKGYGTIGAREIIMPANLFVIYSARLNAWLAARGLKAAEKYARQILDGSARWGRVPWLSDFVFWLFWHGVRRCWLSRWCQTRFRFRVDEKRCTKCGLCARTCPVGNITLREWPEFDLKCNYCMRCLSWCPAGAIPCQVNFRGRTYTAPNLKWTEWLTGRAAAK
jgi:ferredoxin/flavodoxin